MLQILLPDCHKSWTIYRSSKHDFMWQIQSVQDIQLYWI